MGKIMPKFKDNFTTISTELDLTPLFKTSEQLKNLQSWCSQHISNDLSYQGTPAEKYNQYFSLLKSYCNIFLDYLPENPHEKVPQYQQRNAIQYAAEQGYDQFIKNQVSIPREVLDSRNKNGMTPLHVGAIKGYVHTVRALLEMGANPKITNNESQTPIFSALFVPMVHEEDLIPKKIAMFKEILAHAPEILEHKDSSGNTVFHLMTKNQEFYSLLSELLTKDYKGLFICNNKMQYPIHTAILNNQFAITKLLLSIDKVAMLSDAQRRIALHYAAQYGASDIVQCCCEVTPEIDSRDSEGMTPLLLAAESSNYDAMGVLIKYGADNTLVDYLGRSVNDIHDVYVHSVMQK